MAPRGRRAAFSLRSPRASWLCGGGGVEEAEAVRLGGCLAAAGHAQLAQDVGHVDTGRLGRDEQLAGDLPVAAPGRDQTEHLELAFGEPELTRARSRAFGIDGGRPFS